MICPLHGESFFYVFDVFQSYDFAKKMYDVKQSSIHTKGWTTLKTPFGLGDACVALAYEDLSIDT